MTAHLKGPSQPIPLEKQDLTLGREKPTSQIGVLPPNSSSPYQYVKLVRSTKPMYSITDISNSDIGITLNDEKLLPHTPYWLNPDDKIQISKTLYFYREKATGVQLEGVTLPSPIDLKSPALTLGKAVQTVNHIHMVNDKDAADKHATISPRPTGQVYGVIDLGNTPEGTQINYETFWHNLQKPHWLNSDDKLLIGRTSGDKGAVFTYKENGSSSGKSNSSIGVFIFGLIVGFLVALLFSNGAFQSQSTPDQTLASFCDALNKANYQTAYDQFSKNAQKQITEPQFAATLKQTVTRQGGVKNCTTTNVQTNDTTASGTLIMAFQNGKTASYSASLVKEGDTWKIDATKPKLALERQLTPLRNPSLDFPSNLSYTLYQNIQ